MGEKVTLVSPEGKPTTVDAAEADTLLAQQFRPETTEERTGRVAAEARKADLPAVSAFAGRALSSATLGLSDVAARAFGGEDARIRLEQLREAHPTASFLGDVTGAFVPGAAIGRLGRAVEGGLSAEGMGAARAIAARGAGTAAEGAVYGAGNAVSELALSKDPLTAEHVASVLSSNVLLGGGIGGSIGVASKLVERGLQLAGEKLAAAKATRGAVDGLPEDLRGLDEAGLKDAYATAKTEHAADIAAEKKSLEQIRVNQRAEMANRVKDLHEDLATERPIFSALSENEKLTPALKGIEGVGDARVQLASSYGAIRSRFNNALAMQENPARLVDALQQRQGALEILQQKMPEIHAALAGDARIAALEHVDTALAQTREQIAQIKALDSKLNPVSSGRLQMLTSGDSQKMLAIDGAREALKKAPELGLVGKGVKGAVFGGATAVAHMIPGVGMLAPFAGKYAADAVEKLFARTAGAVGKVSEKASGAAEKFLTATKKLEPYVAPTATKVLSAVRFGAGKGEEGGDLKALFKARTSELYAQTMRTPDGQTVMRPEARQAMAGALDGFRQVNPILADQLETLQAKKTAYYAQMAPKKPEPAALQIGPDNSHPGEMAIREWARVVHAGENPANVEERLARGICTPEEAHCYRYLYPERFAALQREIFEKAPQLDKTLPMQKKVALSIFSGIPVTPAMQPNVIAALQSTFDVEPGSAGGTKAPTPQPNFGAIGSLKDLDKPSPAQQREMHP
jgi:hypothetical protein